MRFYVLLPLWMVTQGWWSLKEADSARKSLGVFLPWYLISGSIPHINIYGLEGIPFSSLSRFAWPWYMDEGYGLTWDIPEVPQIGYWLVFKLPLYSSSSHLLRCLSTDEHFTCVPFMQAPEVYTSLLDNSQLYMTWHYLPSTSMIDSTLKKGSLRENFSLSVRQSTP